MAASVFGYGGLANLGGGLASMALLNSFTREDELEADDFALDVLPAAGYDPRGLLTFLKVVEREGSASMPTFLSSHPATEERIEEAAERLSKLPDGSNLESTDNGRFEIIQRRIQLLTRKVRPTGRNPL